MSNKGTTLKHSEPGMDAFEIDETSPYYQIIEAVMNGELPMSALEEYMNSLPPTTNSIASNINKIALKQADGSILLKREDDNTIVLYNKRTDSSLGIVEVSNLPKILAAVQTGTDIVTAVNQAKQ